MWGDRSLHGPCYSFKSLSPYCLLGNVDGEVHYSSLTTSSAVIEVPEAVLRVLQLFADVFVLPTQLPPFRGYRTFYFITAWSY